MVKKRRKVDDTDAPSVESQSTKIEVQKCLKWQKLQAENLSCDYVILYSKKEADNLLQLCEKELIYNTGDLAKVQIFGKWLDIPRKQVCIMVNNNKMIIIIIITMIIMIIMIIL